MGKKFLLPVEGMTCASCVTRVEKIISKTQGIKNVSVNFANEKVSFEAENTDIDLNSIAKELNEYGYKLKVESAFKTNYNSSETKDEYYHELKKDFTISLFFTIPVFLISMLIDLQWFQSVWFFSIEQTQKILFILTTPVIFISGRRFYSVAWNNIRHFSAEMNTLVAIGTASAYGYSSFVILFPESFHHHTGHVYFETAAVIVTLILMGRILENRAKIKSSSAIQELIKLKPSTARLLVDGNETEVDIKELITGQTVIIKPGDKIPADGIIVIGNSTIDESMLTGESIPVEKSNGDKVFAATINLSGSFNFRITATETNSVLGQIIKMVEDAQGTKAPIQKLADKIAGIFVPIVILISILTLISWLILFPESGLSNALVQFIAVLIVACPCALGLATPTAIMVGTGLGAKHGILIRDGENLEIASRISRVVFDKTGTITEGVSFVTDIKLFGVDEEFLLKIAASVETKSEHPIAKAILNYAKNKNIQLSEINNFQALSGFGIQATIDNNPVLIGNRKLMNEFSIDISVAESQIEDLENQSKTCLFVAYNNSLTGIIAVADKIKQTSLEAVSKLSKIGIKATMLSGDNRKTVEKVAAEVGIKDYYSELTPSEKLNHIKKFQSNKEIVAMVGDGINDAPTLMQADIGISIGNGTDVAIESSGITLVKGDLLGVVKAINLSKNTIRTIKENLFWAFIYNIIGIPLAAFGLLNPMIAALAMSLSSVSVVTNSLRLRKAKI